MKSSNFFHKDKHQEVKTRLSSPGGFQSDSKGTEPNEEALQIAVQCKAHTSMSWLLGTGGAGSVFIVIATTNLLRKNCKLVF